MLGFIKELVYFTKYPRKQKTIWLYKFNQNYFNFISDKNKSRSKDFVNLSEDKLIFISVINNKELYEKCVLNNSCIIKNKIETHCLDNTKNNEFISKRYNDFLDNYDFSIPSWFVFCHQDWEIRENIESKLTNLNKNKLYGPIGTILHKKTDGNVIREYRGSCYEKKRDGSEERLQVCHINNTGAIVDTFDCQSLIMHSSLVEKYNLRFDKELTFDLYVEDFCINSKIKHNIESCILNLNCCHWSQVANMDERPEYFKQLSYLNQKYNDYLFAGVITLIGNNKGNKIGGIKNITPALKYTTERSHIYKTDVDINNTNDSRSLMCNMVKNEACVLDVGCACGDMGLALKKNKNCQVYGLEYDAGSIDIAKSTNAYEEISQVDLNIFDETLFKQYYNKFDYIIFGDVLEHLYNPQKILDIFKIFLKKDGFFLLSIPNVAHASIKANLLLDDWTYTDIGLLDRTHLRFFTYKSILKFLSEISLTINDLQTTLYNLNGRQPNDISVLPKEIIKFITDNPHSHVAQYVIKCSKNNSEELQKYQIEKDIIFEKMNPTKYYLFGFIPLLKVKKYNSKTKYYLFHFLLIWKIKI